jgi:hypothetical protein
MESTKTMGVASVIRVAEFFCYFHSVGDTLAGAWVAVLNRTVVAVKWKRDALMAVLPEEVTLVATVLHELTDFDAAADTPACWLASRI